MSILSKMELCATAKILIQYSVNLPFETLMPPSPSPSPSFMHACMCWYKIIVRNVSLHVQILIIISEINSFLALTQFFSSSLLFLHLLFPPLFQFLINFSFLRSSFLCFEMGRTASSSSSSP